MSKSFCLEAASELDEKAKKFEPVAASVAQDFLKQAVRGKLAKSEKIGSVKVRQIDNQKMVCFCADTRKSGGKDLPKPTLLHLTAFPKPKQDK